MASSRTSSGIGVPACTTHPDPAALRGKPTGHVRAWTMAPSVQPPVLLEIKNKKHRSPANSPTMIVQEALAVLRNALPSCWNLPAPRGDIP